MTSQAGFIDLKTMNIMWTFHFNNDMFIFSGSCYISADVPVKYSLPVTSQPGLGRGSSIQGLGRDHIQKPM